MARKRNLFLYNIQPFLKRSKRFILFALLGLMLSQIPGLPSSAKEALPTQSSGTIVASGSSSQPAGTGVVRERKKARALNREGSRLWAMGNPAEALEKWKKAEELYRKAGDQIGVIGSQINQAQALEALGHYRKSCDRILAAFGSDIKCDNLTKGNIDKILESLQTPDDNLKFRGWQSLGNILRKMEKLEESQTVLNASLDVAKSQSWQEYISYAYQSLGNTARDLAKRAKVRGGSEESNNKAALTYYQNAIDSVTSGEIRLQAEINKLSLLIEERDRYREEIQKLRQDISDNIISLSNREGASSRELVSAQINYATILQLLRKESNSDEAPSKKEIAGILENAVKQAEKLGNQRLLSYAKGTLGEVRNDEQQISEALNIAQRITAGDIAYQWQWQLGRLLKQRGDVKEAIGHYEAAFNILQRLRGDLAAFDRDTQFDFKEKVEPVYREYVELLLAGDSPSQENLKQARDVIEGLQLAELDNFFREACVEAEPQEIEKVDPTAAVIYTILVKNKLEVILSIPGQDLIYSSTQLPDNWKGKIRSFKRSTRDAKVILDEDEIQNSAKIVYEWLFSAKINLNLKKFELRLKAEKKIVEDDVPTLVFVLDDMLRNLPMAALYDGEKYLVENYAVAITPGLQLLDPQSFEGEFNILAGGLTKEDAPSLKLPPSLPPLSFADDELKQIQLTIPNSDLIMDEDFTSTNIENQLDLNSYAIVHLATHGNFSSNLENTYILDVNEKINVDQLNKLLRGRKQFRPDPIQLLVLSACETAQGDDRAALGLAGIAVRSGARSTLATLWRVNEESTTDLMGIFYDELNQHKIGKAKALRKAQLALLRDKIEPPRRWAAFVLVGNWL